MPILMSRQPARIKLSKNSNKFPTGSNKKIISENCGGPKRPTEYNG
jgi:hypothetical protein